MKTTIDLPFSLADIRDATKGRRAADELEAAVANLVTEIEMLQRERNDYQARVIPAETEVVRLEAVVADMLTALKEIASHGGRTMVRHRNSSRLPDNADKVYSKGASDAYARLAGIARSALDRLSKQEA